MRTGTWIRRGSTIVVDLGGGAPRAFELELDAQELEAGQPTVRVGSRGAAVSTLQSRLKALRFDPGPVDGIFGSQTERAVRAFQSARRLTVDGIVGPQTWGALDATAAPSPPPVSAPPPAYGGGRGSVRVEVPFKGYQTNDPAGCFRRCKEMAAAVGVTVGGPDVRIQVASREDASGRVVLDPAKMREGIAYIDQQLEARRPVCVGVTYEYGKDYNVDHITDHFVLITTRGNDPAKGLYYACHDPATSHADRGNDRNPANRFFLTPAGVLYRPPSSSAPMAAENYDVSMVRRNA
jgi:hypothetical protein